MKNQVDKWIKDYKGGIYTITEDNNVTIESNVFIISKRKSYQSRLPKICGYANYFFEFYNSHNFINKLIQIKDMIDNTDNVLAFDNFIALIKSELISDDVKDSIHQMVKDNCDDTEEQYKKLMCSVVAINLIYPLVIHYAEIYDRQHTKLYKYFAPIIDIFISIDELRLFTTRMISDYRIKYNIDIDESFYDTCFRKHMVTLTLPQLTFDMDVEKFLFTVIRANIRYQFISNL